MEIVLPNKPVATAVQAMIQRIGNVQIIRNSLGCVVYAGYRNLVIALQLMGFDPEDLEEGKEYTVTTMSVSKKSVCLELTQWPKSMDAMKAQELGKAPFSSVVRLFNTVTSLPEDEAPARLLAGFDLAIGFDVFKTLDIGYEDINAAHGLGTAGIVMTATTKSGDRVFFCSAAMSPASEFAKNWGKGGAKIKEEVALLQPAF